MSEMVKRGRGGVDAADVGIILGISGENEGDDLGLALKSFGEHGADRAVNLAAGEDFALAHAAFALDKAAGNASAGVGVFAVVNGEREKIDARAGLGIGGGGGENDVLANAHDGSDPPACFASFPVSKDRVFPPASSTETLVASGFIFILCRADEAQWRAR